MNSFKEIIERLLSEEKENKTIGVFGGGFKPPTKGHFEVLKKALDENPEIDEMLVFVGKGERDGITQEESLNIWQIYGKYLPFKVKYIKSTKPPIQLIYNTAKENPESEVLWVIGAREENEQDFIDISSRTKGITKYPNLELRTIITKASVSGTAARNASKVSKEKLDEFLPEFLSEKEKQDIFVMLSNTVTENDPEDGKASPYGSGYNPIKENASYSQNINIKREIAKLTQHMLDRGMNIQPLPKLILKNGDNENAKLFLGRTAYYDPNNQSIVLYTEGRHPKDIVRSFSHEMVHHTQFLEDRLGNITTTNTQEDGDLDKIEQEANLKGTMTFRNWTDSLNEGKQVGLLYHSTYPSTLKTILDQNVLKGNLSTYNGKDILAISTTRNKNFKYDGRKAQIVLDGDKLSTKYKIKPYDYWGRNYNIPRNSQAQDEDEEMIITSKIDNIKDYIVNINLDKSLNEAIVGDKIECDNCDWSWDISSGGNDLFVCHKCGHDNEPIIEEKKNKDPFGINAYAMELGRLREEETEYKIYCDLDGVLADFERGYEELTGIDLQGEFKPEGAEFWNPISKAGVGFWAGLKWMSDGQQLWDYIKQYKPELLSAPSRDESSRIGKYVWVKNKIPGTKLILRYADRKKELASPNAILIDDRAKNIEDWESAGGVGILHTNATDTINQLKKLNI